MEPTFSKFIQLCVQESGLQMEAMCSWIADNRDEVGELPASRGAVKERLRYAAERNRRPTEYPHLFQIISYFEAQGKHFAAACLRHVYRQQIYVRAASMKQFVDVSPYHPDVLWMIFPTDNAAQQSEMLEAWKRKLANGESRVLAESLHFFTSFQASLIHDPVRRLVSADLCRYAITQGEYAEAYLIAGAMTEAWRTRVASKLNRSITGMDLYNYLRCLQIKAAALSFVDHYTPLRSSMQLFRSAAAALQKARSEYVQMDPGFFDELKLQYYVRLGRMLGRAFINVRFSEEDRVNRMQIGVLLRRHSRNLERCIASHKKCRYGEIDSLRMAYDTQSRLLAMRSIAEEDQQLLEQAQMAFEQSRSTASRQDSLTDFRMQTTKVHLGCTRYYHAKGTSEDISAAQDVYQDLARLMCTRNPFVLLHKRSVAYKLEGFLREIERPSSRSLIGLVRTFEQDGSLRDDLDRIVEERIGTMFHPAFDIRLFGPCLEQASSR